MKKSFRAAIISVFVFILSCGTSALAADLSSWAEPFYRSASKAGLVSYSIVTNNMKGGITREEFCELMRSFPFLKIFRLQTRRT